MKSANYQGNRTISVGVSEAVPPAQGEVRLDVAFCGICGTDMHIFHGDMDKRVTLPQPIGHEVSATVAEIGAGVTTVSPGDRVAVRPLKFGEPSKFDNDFPHVGKNLKFIGIDLPGGMQASWTVPAYTLHPLPVKFFWSELRLIGTRLYEECDFQEAISLAAQGKLALDKLITQVSPIDDVQQIFEEIETNPNGIKYLIACR